MIRTAIVLINFFKEEELIQFVQDCLSKQLNDERLLVIVDNGSNSNSLDEVFQNSKQIVLLKPQSNLGYFGAARYAWAHLKEKSITSDNFIISNFDLEFDAKRFLDDTEIKSRATEASVIGPNILSSLSGAALNPMYKGRLPLGKLKRLLFVTGFYPFFFIYQWLHHLKRRRSSASVREEESAFVYAIHGSFMVLKRSYFETGGSLDFKSFLYGEELFIAEECRRLGLKILYEPSLKIVHREHTTTGNYKNSKHMKWLHQSLRYIRDEYYVS